MLHGQIFQNIWLYGAHYQTEFAADVLMDVCERRAIIVKQGPIVYPNDDPRFSTLDGSRPTHVNGFLNPRPEKDNPIPEPLNNKRKRAYRGRVPKKPRATESGLSTKEREP